MKDLHRLAVVDQDVTLGVAEEPQDLLRGGTFTATLLGVERKLGDPRPSHGRAQVAFDERLHEEREEVEGEERLDATGVLEQHGRDLVDGLGLLEPFLEGGLAFVGFEDLRRRQGRVVGEQRVHAVALAIVGDGGLVEPPLRIRVAAGGLAIRGVRPGATPPHLPEAMFGAGRPAHGEVAGHLVADEDRLDLLVDLMGGAQARLRASKPPLEVGQLVGGEPLPARLLLP
jgi:hypothetical protein